MLLLIYYARNVLVLYNNPVYTVLYAHMFMLEILSRWETCQIPFTETSQKKYCQLYLHNKPAYTTSLLDASNDFYCPLWPPLTSNGLQWTSKCFNDLQWSWIFCHWIVHVRLFGTFQALLDENPLLSNTEVLPDSRFNFVDRPIIHLVFRFLKYTVFDRSLVCMCLDL